ncbi:MAG: ABC transporter permease [Phycisphaerae bacterium]
MFFLRTLIMAMRSLKANFARSILAILGIVIGVGTVIAAVGVVEGATHEWLSDMEKIGTNVMWVRPGATMRGGVRFAGVKPLLPDDVDDILADERIAAASPEFQTFAQIKFGRKNEAAMVVGTTTEFFGVFSYAAESGRVLTRPDDMIGRSVACIGFDLAEKLFDKRNPVGEEIRIGKHAFTIVGLMKEKGLVGFADYDNQVYIPLTRARAMYNPRSLSQISVRGQDLVSQDAARAAVARVLRQNHRLQLGEPDDFSVVTQKELFERFSNITSIWQAVFLAISGISLVVGGFGIMNIMLVSVTERTREIGVRMALGALRGDVLTQFLAESSMICIVGAPLGIGLGWLLNGVVAARLAPLKPILAPQIVIVAVLVAVATGVVSGLYPAWRASRLDPVEALRYE